MTQTPSQTKRAEPIWSSGPWGLGTLLLVVACVWLLYEIRVVVGAVLGAAILAAALDPPVRRLQALRVAGRSLGRRVASALTVVTLVTILLVLAGLLVPVLVREGQEAAEWLPGAVESVRGQFDRLEATLGGPGSQGSAILHDETSKLMGQVGRTLGTFLIRLTTNLLNILSLLLLPIGAYYLLADGPELRDLVLRHVPPRRRQSAGEMLGIVHRSLSLYVRGQTAVCATAAVLYSLLFWLLGLPNPVLLGTIAGVAEAIPFLGATLTTIVVALAGLSLDPVRAAFAVAFYFVVANSVVNYFLAPRFLSRHLEIHPFLVMLASLAGAALGGFLGALLALPTVVVLQSVATRMGEDAETKSEASGA